MGREEMARSPGLSLTILNTQNDNSECQIMFHLYIIELKRDFNYLTYLTLNELQENILTLMAI